MRFLADENFPLAAFRSLRERGYDIVHISELAPGSPDERVAILADELGRTLLTMDGDFGELAFVHLIRPSQGIVYFRLDRFTAEEPAAMLIGSLTDPTLAFEKRMTVVQRDGTRQRWFEVI